MNENSLKLLSIRIWICKNISFINFVLQFRRMTISKECKSQTFSIFIMFLFECYDIFCFSRSIIFRLPYKNFVHIILWVESYVKNMILCFTYSMIKLHYSMKVFLQYMPYSAIRNTCLNHESIGYTMLYFTFNKM